MKSKQILDFLRKLESLKCNIRHCWTSTGRPESVAEHSWRLAVFAYLVGFNIPNIDNEKLVIMSLVHDWGEAITGDIPTFAKTEKDRINERRAVKALLEMLDGKAKCELEKIFYELEENKSIEARICHALDQLEGILQHNESDLSKWLPLEYTLQLTYGKEESRCAELIWQCRKDLEDETLKKIENIEKAVTELETDCPKTKPNSPL